MYVPTLENCNTPPIILMYRKSAKVHVENIHFLKVRVKCIRTERIATYVAIAMFSIENFRAFNVSCFSDLRTFLTVNN